MSFIVPFVSPDLFFDQLTADIQSASDRVWIQCMSFEGDGIGKKITQLLCESSAKSKCFLIDSYTKVVHNDRLLVVPAARFDAALMREQQQTQTCISEMSACGVDVQFTNPLGFMLHKYPLRNHKKLIIIDNIVYIGGRNFCDHNFIWRDSMIRFDFGKEQYEALRSFFVFDFDASRRGVTHVDHIRDQQVMAWSVAGASVSKPQYDDLLSFIGAATTTITVFSPYISGPIMRALCHCARNHRIKVNVFIPIQNNKPIFQSYFSYIMATFPITFVYVSGEMNHTKAMIIDEQSIILGSSNFDVVSYYLEDEIVVAVTDPTHVKNIQSELFSGLHEAESPRRISRFKSVVVWYGFRVIEWLIQGYARLFKSA